MIITPTSLSVTQLLGSTNEQYVIPAYQRRYSWHERQVWELIDDIRLIEEGDTHLLGSIVCLAGHHKAGLNRLELVDGQQRVTTISIILECIRQRLEKEGESDDANDIGRLLTAKPLGGSPFKKIALDSIDSEEFERLIQNDTSQDFQNDRLRSAFGIVRGWIGEQSKEVLAAFLYRLTNHAIVIRLDVSEAKDAFKLFETINNRGLRLSPTDIIKNFLLGNAARFSDDALQHARASWAALIKHLDGTSPDAFFRYYLMSHTQTRLTAFHVVATFKKVFMSEVVEAAELPDRHLYADDDEVEDEEDVNGDGQSDELLAEIAKATSEHVTFRDFLERLVKSAKVYGELVLVNTGNDPIDRRLRNLRMIKAVQTYGFLTYLRVGGCDDKIFREILELTESFILRRHVCRERSNDTEALFARLCGVDPKDPIPKTKEEYRDLCPTDDKFREEFSTASFPARLIDRARYCLEKIEVSKHGDHDELKVLGSSDVHVEHIIPQKITTKKSKDEFGDWITYLGTNAQAHHPKYVSRIGNLTLFAGALNIVASNNPFGRKKQSYKKSSILLTKELAGLQNFKFYNVEKRSQDLAALAVKLWPMP